MEAEGVTFHYDAHIGVTVMGQSLVEEYDAIALAGGSESSRDLPVPGRDLDGVHFAMEFLPQQNRRVSNEPIGTNASIVAAGKRVVVIGGGDTGSDCIGTSIRQGALKVTQLEIMPMPPKQEDKMLTWPNWPLKLRTSSSHEEGAERDFAVNTVAFEGDSGVVTGLQCVRIDEKMKPIAGTEFTLPADLVLLAMGFVSPVKDGLLAELGVSLDPRGNVLADTKKYASSKSKVFACGDMRRGQSLVVWAIREGRQCAAAIDEALMGSTVLPR
jgi:glutamate synthase (NADPH/NADH) small chain